MTEEDLKSLASQLRMPHGEIGIQVAEFMNQGNELLNRNTINTLDLREEQSILEIGMGNGKFVPELLNKAKNLKYTGCDFSELMVKEAIANNTTEVSLGTVRFQHADAAQMPFGQNEFDVVFTVNTLYFWENHEATLAEIKRVLRPGGQLVIGIRPKELMQHYSFVKYGFRMFNPQEVIDLLNENGFTQTAFELHDEPDFVTEEATFKVKSLVVKGVRP